MKEPLNPELVVFDLDNTMYDYHLCHSHGLSEVSSMLKSMIPRRNFSLEKAYSDARRKVKTRVDGPASHSRTLYFSEILSNLNMRLDRKLLLDMVSIYWSTFFKHMQPAKGLEDLLKKFRLSGTKISLVTDFTTEIQYQKLFVLNLLELFDVIVTSEEAGGEKNSFKPFELMLDRLGMPQMNLVWFFGDEAHDFPTTFPAANYCFFGSPFMTRNLRNVEKISSYELL